ncbi:MULTISPECIES: DUF2242 domain-containing protein [Pseudomonas]|uniref:Lipoprotein n=1 Tax=Pseudomonas parafulva TaxID=157782 RepID=A0ABN4XYG4_9PSED|nr:MULTISPECIES: DUF2242 domain-containing protein [Pseudomonas]AQW67939.1 hypothetical protein B2J77_06780 [Pseudomonas parafulva]MBF8677905.1 DUF2242 domain-containing protein [Pseudomonas fulva]MBF8694303.1 DUF2242 domain-containing protein [Pseudomonas fulva]MBF8719520.1 DUF2242 domain-containing protein [Pseudomonas fulva]MBF8784920.1 DUF2242 domain-containing protein [Pseudomonas fulva]
MTRSSVSGALVLAALLAVLSGCASKKPAVYEHENFDDSGTFSRSFPVGDANSCEAARRALLSQGYIITSSGPNQVVGNKSFQQNSDNHLQISFNVTCAPDASDEQHSTMFANALQDRYALKKSNTSASLGVGVLGSVSMPIGSSDDSMVKVASETVTAAQFYDRYFALVESYLPKPKPKAQSLSQPKAEQPAPKTEKPAVELGLPEQAAASPAPVPVEAAPAAPDTAPKDGASPAAFAPDQQTVQAPASGDQLSSQPVAPPADAAPIEVQQAEPVTPASQDQTAPQGQPSTP